jgi:MipA family protein
VPFRRISQIATALALLACAGVSRGADECADPSEDCVAVGRWNFSVALGAGVRTNPLHHGQDIPLLVIPQFSYYGKRFFLDNLDPGVSLYEDESNTLSLIASPGYDRVFFYRSDLQNFFVGGFQSQIGQIPDSQGNYVDGLGIEIRPRHPAITYLAGPEWTFTRAGMTGQLDVLHEITGRHHGNEIRAGLGIPLGYLAGTWKANVGFTWKSAALVNYYYGYPGIYDPGWALNPFAKIGYSRPLSRRWKLDAFVHCERLGNGIANSPIVGPRYVKTAFIGATYVFHH